MTADRIAATVACGLVAAGVIAGFSLTGSPQNMRTQALDRRRADDLRAVVEAVQRRYAQSDTVHAASLPDQLPPTLRASRSDGSDARHDPVTGSPYRYARETRTRFRLCATFALADDRQNNYDLAPHAAGRVCYRFKLGSSYEVYPIGDPIPER
jgi:hypothetical protein